MTTKLGSLIVDIEADALSAEDRDILAHPLVGGIILFTRNYQSRKQLQCLCDDIRSTRKTPLLIMVDQEGGRVQRFVNEFTRIPYMAEFGKAYDKNPASGRQLAQQCGWLMASELLSVGVDLSLAPVLDLNKGISGVIGDRAFHSDPTSVTILARSFMIGMKEAGMAATGKHFPGHGSVKLDSHLAIPTDERHFEQIAAEDLLPFAQLSTLGIDAMMAAHIIFSNVDSQAVGYSRYWLHEILRQRLGFTGVIFSDDLNMEGANISANYVDRVVAAREAGCDITLLCNNRKGVIDVLDDLPYESHLLGMEKWGVLQSKFMRDKTPLENNLRWQKTRELLADLAIG